MLENHPNEQYTDKPQVAVLPIEQSAPITRAAVDSILVDMHTHPQEALLEELQEVKKHANLISYLVVRNKEKGYLEGAFWMHRLLRVQAELSGRELPQLTTEDTAFYYSPKAGMLGRRSHRAKEFMLIDREPIMETVFPLMAPLTVANVTSGFKSGAADVYTMLKAAQPRPR